MLSPKSLERDWSRFTAFFPMTFSFISTYVLPICCILSLISRTQLRRYNVCGLMWIILCEPFHYQLFKFYQRDRYKKFVLLSVSVSDHVRHNAM